MTVTAAPGFASQPVSWPPQSWPESSPAFNPPGRPRSFAGLEAEARDGLQRLLADVAPIASLDVILGTGSQGGYVLVYNRSMQNLERPFRAMGTLPAWDRLVNVAPAALSTQVPLHHLLDFEASGGLPPTGPSAGAIAACVRVPEAGEFGFYLRLATLSHPPGQAVLSRIKDLTQSLAWKAAPLVECELGRRRNELVEYVHELMLPALLASSRPRLMDYLSEVLEAIFGFGRIYVGLMQEGEDALKTEVRQGFESALVPFSIPLGDASDGLDRLIDAGRILYAGREAAPLPGLRHWGGQATARRAVLAPLKVGLRPLGLIYADRPRAEDAFVFPEAFQIFVRLAGAAIENLRQRAEVEQRAETDSLTGLYNRAFLDRILEVEIPRVRRYNSPISLLMIDLCDFKKTNDAYGHLFGDLILREAAGLIRSHVREPDIVVRWGGDEFVVLMVNTSSDQARPVRDRIDRAFRERNRAQTDERMIIDISMGLRSADASTIATLLPDADRSMYRHKAERRKRQVLEALLGLPGSRSDAVDFVIANLLANLDKREPFYPDHARRVAYLALFLASSLNLGPTEWRAIALAALLHDLGKASLPAELLQRPGPLNPAEYKAVQRHAILGEEFLQDIPHLEEVRPLIRHHHERYDGLTTGPFPGYPHGLLGQTIPLGARVLKLADSLDAILSARPYRPARSLERALEILSAEAGASFDPELVPLLLQSTEWRAARSAPRAAADLYQRLVRQAEDAEIDFPAVVGAFQPA